MDELTLKVRTDFSDIEQQFKKISSSLEKYSDIPELKSQVDNLATSFSKLIDMSKTLDTVLSSSKGIKNLTTQINNVNRDAKNISKISTDGSSTSGVTIDSNAIKLDTKVLTDMLVLLKASLANALPQVKENEALKKVSSEIENQEIKASKKKKEIVDFQNKQADEELTAIKQVSRKKKQQSIQADMQSSLMLEEKLNSSGNTKKGILYQTIPELQQELALLTAENDMVGKIVTGFQDIVNLVNLKNQFLSETINKLSSDGESITFQNNSKTGFDDISPKETDDGSPMTKSDELERDRVLQQESTIRYNMRKQQAKEEQQELEKVYKIQDRIFKLKEQNLNSDENIKKYNNEKIFRLEEQEKALLSGVGFDSVAKAFSNKNDLQAKLDSVSNDKSRSEDLKQQNAEFKKSVDLVKELIRLETELAKNPGANLKTQLNDEYKTISSDLAKQRLKLSINQRSELDSFKNEISNKPLEAGARALDRQEADDIKLANSQLELEKKKLSEIENYLVSIQNKLNEMKRNYGSFLDTPEIKSQIDSFVNSLRNSKTAPTNFNRSSANNIWDAINSNIKNKAGQEGLSNVNTMYNKLIALIKEESNVKLKAYKIDGEDNGLMEEKLKLVQKQISELEALLGKYNLLNNSQRESLEIEKQKSNATFESGKSLFDKSFSDTGQKIKEDLINPTNQFYSAFNRGGEGVINQLTSFQSKLYGVRYALEGVMALAGGKKVYDWLIGTNAQIETLQKSMEVTMHSTEKAEKSIQSLRSYAALTAFQETETFRAGETLSANRMDVDKWIRTAGDLAAAKQPQGIELNDVIDVITRINSGDFGKAMIRLRQLGISLSDFRAQGLQFSKNNTYLGNTDEMLEALQRIVSQRYGGMTEVLGNTVAGSISTITDYFQQIGIDLGGGIFNQFSAALQKWKKQIQEFRDSPEFQQIISNFNKAFNTLKDFISPLGSGLKEVILLFAKFLPEIATYVKLLTGIKITQAFFKGFDTLQSNWKKVNTQLTIQKQLIAQSGEATILENSASNRLYDTLSRVVAMRKLGLHYADETAVADAVAAGNIQARGVKFAQKNYTNASNQASNIAQATGVATSVKLAKSALSGAGAEAGLAGIGAGITNTLGIAALVLPIVNVLVGSIRQAVESPESKYTSEDYERIASERGTEVNRLAEINLQRQTARAQIEYYTNAVEQTKAEVESAKSVSESSPKDKAALDAYNNALHSSADAVHRLSSAQEQLTQANRQLLNIAPELVKTLMDQKGSITDNTSAFDENTKAIEDNIRSRKLDIAYQKEKEIQAARAESAKSEQQIIRNNSNIRFASNANRGVGIAGASFFNLLGGITDIAGLSDVLGINKIKESYNLAAQNSTDKQITINGMQVDNNKLFDTVQNSQKLEALKNEAIQRKFFIEGTDQVDWQIFLKQKDREEKTNNNYLMEDEGVATRASEIQSNGDIELENIKNAYQVNLNEIKKRNNGTENEEYKDMIKQRDDAVREIGNQVLNELEAIQSSNSSMRMSALARAEGSKIQRITDIMKNDDDIKVSDITDAVEQLRSDGDAIITGKLHEYQESIREFFKLDLGGIADNINLYRDQLDTMERINNNEETIKNEINKAKLKMDSITEESKNGKSALQSFNDEWERRRQMAETQKEIELQRQQMQGNYEGSQSYKNARTDQSKQVRAIILDEIEGLNKLLNSQVLSDEDTWQARKQISDLQKEANNLALEIDDRLNKDALGAFHEKWDVQNNIEEAKRDLALQENQLNNYDTQSTKYIQDQKSMNMGIRDRLLAEARELQSLIPKLDSKSQLDATLQMINLNKEANQILLDIKKNTDQFGEFNKPSFVKAMTYYDYMTQDSDSKSIEIGSAEFVFKIDAPQTQEDVQNILSLVQTSLGQHVTSSDRRGIVNPNTRG
jgi:hypothetical protein